MGAVLTLTVEFNAVTCCVCGIQFCLPQAVYKRCLETKQDFWCPAGHQQHFTESKVEQLEKQIKRLEEAKQWEADRAKRNAERADRAERSRSALKGKLTLHRKRAAAGVCPCCKRTVCSLPKGHDGECS